MASLGITPLHPALGARVTGVDLAAPLDEPTRHALARALSDHLALVFRDQSLTPAQYLAAAAAFGPPMAQHYSQHNMPDFPLIGLIWHRNGQQPAEQWHTDHTNRERPPAATILYGVEIPPAGGGTSATVTAVSTTTVPDKDSSLKARNAAAWSFAANPYVALTNEMVQLLVSRFDLAANAHVLRADTQSSAALFDITV